MTHHLEVADLTAKNAHLQAECERLSKAGIEAHKVIARVWKALGISTYEEANGQTVDEIVADYKQAASVEAGLRREFLARAEAAETKLAEAEKRLRESPVTNGDRGA